MYNGEPLKYRFRTGWAGCLVLQVLIERVGGDITINASNCTYGEWRDARAQDISRMDKLPTALK